MTMIPSQGATGGSSGDASDDAPLGDDLLIVRLRAGDAEAFEHIVRTHGASLIQYASRFLGSIDRAREAVQDVYLRLWNDREHLKITRDLVAYLFWATRNHATHLVQADLAAQRREARWGGEIAHDTSHESPVPASIEAEETRAAIVVALEGVPLRCREIFMLVWDEQLSYADVAAFFGISVATVRNQMSRAVRHLAKTFEDRRV